MSFARPRGGRFALSGRVWRIRTCLSLAILRTSSDEALPFAECPAGARVRGPSAIGVGFSSFIGLPSEGRRSKATYAAAHVYLVSKVPGEE